MRRWQRILADEAARRRDVRGRTPLLEAARKHHKQALMVLVDEFGADVSAVDADGVSALEHTTRGRSRKPRLMDALLRAGAALTSPVEAAADRFQREFSDSDKLEDFVSYFDGAFSADWKYFDPDRYVVADSGGGGDVPKRRRMRSAKSRRLSADPAE